MLDAGKGLVAVDATQLRTLLRELHRANVKVPLTADQLACVGLQSVQEPLLGALRGLDGRAIQAVLVCVLAERSRGER